MKRIILFFAAVILLATAGNTQAAFQDKKPTRQDPPVATAREQRSRR